MQGNRPYVAGYRIMWYRGPKPAAWESVALRFIPASFGAVILHSIPLHSTEFACSKTVRRVEPLQNREWYGLFHYSASHKWELPDGGGLPAPGPSVEIYPPRTES